MTDLRGAELDRSDAGGSLWHEIETLPIRAQEDLVLVRTAVRRAALSLKFGLIDTTKLVTAASEIARNTLDYGLGGTVLIERLLVATVPATPAKKSGIRLTFIDHGPGIPDLKLALTDGWTSGSGLGLGLTGTRRLVDEFDLQSQPREGTTVTITKWSR